MEVGTTVMPCCCRKSGGRSQPGSTTKPTRMDMGCSSDEWTSAASLRGTAGLIGRCGRARKVAFLARRDLEPAAQGPSLERHAPHDRVRRDDEPAGWPAVAGAA